MTRLAPCRTLPEGKEEMRGDKIFSEKASRFSVCASFRPGGDGAAAGCLPDRWRIGPDQRHTSSGYLSGFVSRLGDFDPQTDHSDSGAPLSHRYFCSHHILDCRQNHPVFAGERCMADPVPVAPVLCSPADDSAAGSVYRAVAGKRRKFPTAEVDSIVLYTNGAAPDAGSDQRFASDRIHFSCRHCGVDG